MTCHKPLSTYFNSVSINQYLHCHIPERHLLELRFHYCIVYSYLPHKDSNINLQLQVNFPGLPACAHSKGEILTQIHFFLSTDSNNADIIILNLIGRLSESISH